MKKPFNPYDLNQVAKVAKKSQDHHDQVTTLLARVEEWKTRALAAEKKVAELEARVSELEARTVAEMLGIGVMVDDRKGGEK